MLILLGMAAYALLSAALLMYAVLNREVLPNIRVDFVIVEPVAENVTTEVVA